MCTNHPDVLRLGELYASNMRAFRRNKAPRENTIATADLRHLLRTSTFGLSEQQVEEVLNHADQSDDGFIDYAEFCNTLMPQTLDLKGNPMELLNTRHSCFNDKRQQVEKEFGSQHSSAMNSSFGAQATGGRFGLRPFHDTFQHFQPDPSTNFHMTGRFEACLANPTY